MMTTYLSDPSINIYYILGFSLIVLALLGNLLLFLVAFRASTPTWKVYEGSIITAIRLAEKAIPDDTPHAGLRRLDEALRFVVEVYSEQHDGRQPSDSLIHHLREGIQIMHDELERRGVLNPRTPDTRTSGT